MRQRRAEQWPKRGGSEETTRRISGWREQHRTATEERDALFDIADTLPGRMRDRMRILAEDIYDFRLRVKAKSESTPGAGSAGRKEGQSDKQDTERT